MITFEEFELLSRSYNVIPFVRSSLADLHTPVSTYLTLRQEGSASFLFETVESDEKIGRYSFIGVDPIVSIRENERGIEIRRGNETLIQNGNIFRALEAYVNEYRQAPIADGNDASGDEPPDRMNSGLLGGFVGYLGYDAVRHIEKVPMPAQRAMRTDESRFDLFLSIIRFDHRLQALTIIHNVILDPLLPLKAQYERGRQAVDTLELRLRRSAMGVQQFICNPAAVEEETDRSVFCRWIERAKEYIFEGDIFQVVLSRRIHLRYSGDAFPVYRALRIVNPSPYLFFVDFGATKLIGSSPEVLVRVQDGTVEVLPIAGTRKRGETENEDLRLQQELLQDEKELAEHIMLVDLGRNDVGRICQYGTVEVPVLKRVDRYSHVMHIVSHVRGNLRSGLTALDALKSCFPAGTVSGAPKVRAMEIISELEGSPRGLYAGAVGYLGLNGNLDTCIAIRTIIADGEDLTIQVGAGVVADSVPEKEYEETVNKSAAMLDAVRRAARGLGQQGIQSGDTVSRRR
jgi:anthranilate synthase component 1